MSNITLQGKEINTNGEELQEVSLADFKGKKKLLNIVPGLDTSTCAVATRKFNESVKNQDGLLAGIPARAAVVLDENDKVLYTQLVPEVSEEPDYDSVLAALK
jgi:thiol peroxidase